MKSSKGRRLHRPSFGAANHQRVGRKGNDSAFAKSLQAYADGREWGYGFRARAVSTDCHQDYLRLPRTTWSSRRHNHDWMNLVTGVADCWQEGRSSCSSNTVCRPSPSSKTSPPRRENPLSTLSKRRVLKEDGKAKLSVVLEHLHHQPVDHQIVEVV